MNTSATQLHTPEHVDPVCRMDVDPSTDLRTEHLGRTYLFCHPSCLERFTANPSEFLAPREMAAAIPGAIYTCPMHPEVRQEGPVSCPICGMALEPELITLDDRDNPELTDMTRRFTVAALLGLPVMLLAMAGMVAPAAVQRLVPLSLANWIQLALATPVVFWAGWPFFSRAWASVVNRSANMFTLIAMGVGAAWVYSVIATVAPG
ncbi:MAG: heavy metal-binding domain-containing protein [Acidobacteriota bacterium]